MSVGPWNPQSLSQARGTTRVLSNPSEQWKLSLQEVKLLHLKCRYKQCAVRSVEILSKFNGQLHKVHEAYFQYYIAASYENLGQASHNFSSNKIPLLRIAMDSYIACKDSLENAFADPERIGEIEESPEFYPASHQHPDRTHITAKREYIFYQSARENSRSPTPFQAQRLDKAASTKTKVNNNANEDVNLKTDLIPLPLQIRKNRQDKIPQYNQACQNSLTAPPRPLPEPPVAVPANHASKSKNDFTKTSPSIHLSNDERPKKSTLDPTPRMTSIIASLSAQIDENIRDLSNHINKATELQRAHKTRKMNRLASYWSFTPTYPNGSCAGNDGKTDTHDLYGNTCTNGSVDGGSSSSDEGKQQRIARLKAEGWNTVGIKSLERGWKGTLHYDRVCSEALSELYGP